MHAIKFDSYSAFGHSMSNLFDSRLPVDMRSTDVSLSNLLMFIALYVSLEYPLSEPPPGPP